MKLFTCQKSRLGCFCLLSSGILFGVKGSLNLRGTLPFGFRHLCD